ncbi:hypothetical protein ACIA8H_23320 [Streptomyces goshikiensis]|uniref:hypothetical protein n=1 Tax=Streptomyces goshikiensis TaxID=1942 RepID=UPI0037AF779A
MTNREFGELSNSPADPDDPSVDDLIQALRKQAANPAENFAYRSGPVRPTDHEVFQGEWVNDGSGGEVTEAEMAKFLKTATARQLRQAPDTRSCVEHRDAVTGETIRTYSDGRAEAVAEQGRRSRSE